MEKLTSLFLFIASAIIFGAWFTAREVIGGDWPYFFSSFLNEFTLFPHSWAAYQGNGLGGEFISYSLDSYLYLVVYLFVNVLHIPWEIVYKVFFFGFYIVSSILSSIYLLTTVLPTAKIWHKMAASFIFTVNTYILMVVGGGQMGVALAYSVAPLVLATFVKLINLTNSSGFNSRFSIIAGLVLAFQVMFDTRIAYLSMIAVAIYLVLQITKKNIPNTFLPVKALAKWGYLILYVLIVPMGITILLHASWILPLVTFRSSPVNEIISYQSSVGAFEFFSFASFSQSFSLVHPNWPENIFGKIGFMKPEFLILPILAYASLLFIKSNIQIKDQINNRTILFFALLGLLGAFLAKGANPPFGEINIWMFTHMPGFTFFRDPTKFYLLIALSYLVLIPFSISSVRVFLKSKIKNQKSKIHNQYQIFNFSYIFLIFTILYLLFLIHPAFFGQLGGTFKKHEVAHEYMELKNFLNNQNGFFRTLWIPRQQRFTYYSNTHPSVEGLSLLKTTSSAEVIDILNRKNSQNYLSDLSIKYLIVPYDEFGEIFVKDRKYDGKQYQYTIEKLKTVPWLKRINGFGKIAVFEIPNPKDHFWIKEGDLSYKMLSPDRYSLKISTPTSTSLLFSEAYSPHWTMKIENEFVAAEKTKSGINSFKIIKVGNYEVEVYFAKEIYYRSGWAFSILALFLLSTFLYKQKKDKVNI